MAAIKKFIQKFIQQNIYPTNYIRIGNVIEDCFEYLKIYLFRLEYSLDDYDRQQIQWSYHTFRSAIWITLNSWIYIFFNVHLAQYPSYFLLKILKSFEQIFHFERVDLLFQFQISVLIILEYQWFEFFRKILGYNFYGNKLFRKYCYQFDDNQLDNNYRQYLTRFIRLVTIELISKITIVYCSIFLSKQIEMNLFNTNLMIYLLSALIATNVLYSKASQLPYYNRCGSLSIMNWLARLQYQQQQQQQQRQQQHNGRNQSIRNAIRSNLFAQSMSDNYLGFTCGQMFILTKYKFIEIFLMNFQLVLLFYKKSIFEYF
uniref:Uncharacterized protein LOC113796538 n=1 Tax=Dermatophagoides pteronyssinus TaxID=6956 RepID=A0A6P6YBH8_DERPT|nr:uncharacterized protein LOC113796538 [Dermatophagoides pteronyssinus]